MGGVLVLRVPMSESYMLSVFQSFEQFVKTRVKEESKEKRTKLLLARDGFRKLLEESKVSPR